MTEEELIKLAREARDAGIDESQRHEDVLLGLRLKIGLTVTMGVPLPGLSMNETKLIVGCICQSLGAMYLARAEAKQQATKN